MVFLRSIFQGSQLFYPLNRTALQHEIEGNTAPLNLKQIHDGLVKIHGRVDDKSATGAELYALQFFNRFIFNPYSFFQH
ncbi:hypothetical protein D3C71_1731360 [compost metagenome]